MITWKELGLYTLYSLVIVLLVALVGYLTPTGPLALPVTDVTTGTNFISVSMAACAWFLVAYVAWELFKLARMGVLALVRRFKP